MKIDARRLGVFGAVAVVLAAAAFGERQYLWPEGAMPGPQPHQFAAMRDVARSKGFNPDEWRQPYLDWGEGEDPTNRVCAILISGGSYKNLADVKYVNEWREKLAALGCRTANLVYRTPWPNDAPFYATAWQDGQRAVRLARAAAAERGFDPEKIVTVSMSAGSHLATLLSASSQTPAYPRVDDLDDTPCHINGAIAFAPAFVLTDGLGKPNTQGGDGPDVVLDDCFKFDEKTAPMCLLHGGKDVYSPLGSTKIYRELRKRKVPAELHLFANQPHRALGLDRAVEFMRQMGWLGDPGKEVLLMSRFPDDPEGVVHEKEPVWPEGKMPDRQANQPEEPSIEWYVPTNLTTRAVLVLWSGGSYNRSKPLSYEVAPVRRFLNAHGIAVVTLDYRHPRPENGLAKHVTAWQDAQRAIRIVRSKAAQHGLDPQKIGAMGFSAGGHLSLMASLSSSKQSYAPIDAIDELPCNVQYAIAVYPAYVLTDGLSGGNKHGGNLDKDVPAPEFAFDDASPRMLFLHGDADGYSPMGSVKVWEQLRRMGVQSDLHTLVKRGHCFQKTASPGTASYTFLDRILEAIPK